MKIVLKYIDEIHTNYSGEYSSIALSGKNACEVERIISFNCRNFNYTRVGNFLDIRKFQSELTSNSLAGMKSSGTGSRFIMTVAQMYLQEILTTPGLRYFPLRFSHSSKVLSRVCVSITHKSLNDNHRSGLCRRVPEWRSLKSMLCSSMAPLQSRISLIHLRTEELLSYISAGRNRNAVQQRDVPAGGSRFPESFLSRTLGDREFPVCRRDSP